MWATKFRKLQKFTEGNDFTKFSLISRKCRWFHEFSLVGYQKFWAWMTNPWYCPSSSVKCMLISRKEFRFHVISRFFIHFFRITNLKYWGGSETIISKTLQLLNDLSVGYGTVRKLGRFFTIFPPMYFLKKFRPKYFLKISVKLDEVGFLLSHHTAEHYPFLGKFEPGSQLGVFKQPFGSHLGAIWELFWSRLGAVYGAI